MELWMLIFCVMPTFVTSVTIVSNGNSPETKMTRHIMSESIKYNPITTRSNEAVKYKANKSNKINSTKLGINERYRRLIPYMTFYYANDIATPSPVPEQDQEKSVEVDKAEIIETGNINPSQREERVIHSFLRQKNIPRYQGNRLTYHNIASANPSKYVKEVLPTFYQPSNKFTPNYNPLFVDHNIYPDREREYEKFIVKPIKAPSAPFSHQTRKPFLNFDQNNDANVHYYLSEKEVAPKYKLVPYDQTPPIKTFQQYENVESIKQYVPVEAQKEPVYIKPRQKPTPPQFFYIHENEQYRPKKPPTTISEMYYEKQTAAPLAEPIIESGFHPIIPSRPQTTESPLQYTREYHHPIPKLERPPEDVAFRKPSYQYVLEESSYIPKPTHNENTKTASLADLLNSLQINKSIPKPITKDNISASINTLLQVLNALKAQQNQIESPVLSTPKPFAVPDSIVKTTPKPLLHNTVESPSQDIHFEEPYLAQVNSPSQHLDDYPSSGSSQQFPQPIYSDEEGGTPGRPGVDYPILTIIPPTKFDCKTQRYKGFFADPETRCQVWHYCDLNGGQASFLCPNGTIFSQAGLTCDWWFNVRCASTPQLYVLNESLYKFILPHSPKFPEDYSGPLVDKYLTLKFKEMEEQFKKNKSKNKQTASEKIDDEEDTKDAKSSEETSTDSKSDTEDRTLNNAAVIIESAGSSGNVERLQE